jgi:hypothetical protein
MSYRADASKAQFSMRENLDRRQRNRAVARDGASRRCLPGDD